MGDRSSNSNSCVSLLNPLVIDRSIASSYLLTCSSTDVNDNIPQCLSLKRRLSILENVSVTLPIMKVNASDSDDGPNGTITYSLRTNASWPFEINSKTGDIYSRKPFDYESEFKNFSLIIDLEDEGFPVKHRNENACELEITVEDVNDNRPELIDDEQTRLFVDTHKAFQPEIVVFNVKDADSGDNGHVKYSLQSADEHGLFTISQNGSLQMTQPINEISVFKLQVLLGKHRPLIEWCSLSKRCLFYLIEDEGVPSQRTILNVTIAIGDSSIPAYSTFDKVQLKYARPTNIGLILGLIVLISTCVLFVCVILICAVLRRHRRRDQAAIIARKKLFCSSSQQLTSSGSTTTTNTTSSSSSASSSSSSATEHPPTANMIQLKPTHWDEKPYDQRSSHSYTSMSSIDVNSIRMTSYLSSDSS